MNAKHFDNYKAKSSMIDLEHYIKSLHQYNMTIVQLRSNDTLYNMLIPIVARSRLSKKGKFTLSQKRHTTQKEMIQARIRGKVLAPYIVDEIHRPYEVVTDPNVSKPCTVIVYEGY